jgi:hypothetical protein
VRLSLLLGTLSLAWPSLKRPAQWLPAGMAAVILIAIAACAFQPRLAIAIAPLVGTLIAFAGFVRFFRSK